MVDIVSCKERSGGGATRNLLFREWLKIDHFWKKIHKVKSICDFEKRPTQGQMELARSTTLQKTTFPTNEWKALKIKDYRDCFGFQEPASLLSYHLLLPYASCNSSLQSFSCLVCIFFSIIKRWMANTQSYDWGGWLVPNAVSCVRLFVVIWLSLCLEIHNWFMVIVFEMNFMWFINSNLNWDLSLSLSLTTHFTRDPSLLVFVVMWMLLEPLFH